MSTSDFMDRYFDIAMKIHAFCFDNGYTKDDAKLYVYMYVKMAESPDGINYFDGDCTTDIIALQSLLKIQPMDGMVFTEPLTPQDLQEMYSTFVASSLRKLEYDLQQEFGLENVLTSELVRRLKFHTDTIFRTKYLDTFKNKIIPGIIHYNEIRVKISNINYQLKLFKEEEELDFLINS
jgi:hypothetical protein